MVVKITQKDTPRKKRGTPRKNTPSSSPVTLKSSYGKKNQKKGVPTKKQIEALQLYNKGMSYRSIGRELNINESSVRDRLDGLLCGEYVKKISGGYEITKRGEFLLKNPCGVGCADDSELKKQKGAHSNEFEVNILKLPLQWYSGVHFIQSLSANDYAHETSSKFWFLYYDDCTIRIDYTQMKMVFWVKHVVGNTFDSVMIRRWDKLMYYYRMMKHNGFKLEHRITPKNKHLTNPDGFFAKLASYSNLDSFKVETEDGDIWVDRSPGYEEEEHTNEEKAIRSAKLMKSAYTSESDFNDLDKLIEITKNLVKIQVLKAQNENIIPNQTAIPKEDLNNQPNYFG